MKGDFSRDTYHAGSQYSRVMMQQGRVLLDADWNEQNAILLGYMRALTRDLFGPHAGPAEDCGFQVVTAASRANLSKDSQGRIDLALRNRKLELDGDDILIAPGRYYVAGLPVENAAPLLYRKQAGFPFGETPTESLLQRNWLAYLDVWEDYVAADQDAAIRDVALGGIDTCGRARIRWQVRLLLDPKGPTDLDRRAPTGSGRIRVRANPSEIDDNLCSIAPDARYRGAENQLYRIEIQAGGKADDKQNGATFKWSRDNASFVFPIASSSGNRVLLQHLGRDAASTLVEGDWVELIDDRVTGAGLLAQVTTVQRDDVRVELALPDGSAAAPTYAAADAVTYHALLRRWDHRGDPKHNDGAIAIVEGAEIELEDGVKVTFEAGGEYRAGDYWTVAARVATGDVEWPGGPDSPEFRLPDGPRHYYAPLAIAARSPAGQFDVTDLRCRIERLPCLEQAGKRVVAPAPKATGVGKTATGGTKKPDT